MLDQRVLDLRGDLHEHFERIWKVLVQVDHEHRCVHIRKSLDYGGVDIENAIIVMKAFKEFSKYMVHLANDLEALVLGPRIDLCCQAVPTLQVVDVSGSDFQDKMEILIYGIGQTLRVRRTR